MDEIGNQGTNNQEPENTNQYQQPAPVEPNIYNGYSQISNQQSVNISFSLKELRSLSGWSTFRAVINIIVGALTCLGSLLSLLISFASFVGQDTNTNAINQALGNVYTLSASMYLIIGISSPFIGVILIISGVKLLNASDSIKRYLSSNDLSRLSDSMNSFGKYFKLFGITTIIKIVTGIVLFIVLIVLIASVASGLGDYMNQFPF
ncbi:MAG: DUF5362 domain-containing protein [Clostridia bacterium]|nr:DUF5362 domain-containing protein [Clostridia bacterium]